MTSDSSFHRSLMQELSLGKNLAMKAGEIMLRFFEGEQQEQQKGDGTAVTIADKKINTLVIEEIKKQFPDDIIIGEEESTGDYGMGRRWICDPIDGTAAFIIGLPSSMFSLCLVIDGIPTVAVTYEPHGKNLYTSIRGQGSYCNNTKLHVSERNLDKARLALAPDYVSAKYINESFMKRLLSYNKRLAVFDGAVFRSCMVAKGRIDGFVHPAVKPYDIAAGHLLIEEAGGRVTDIYGNPLSYAKEFRGAILSNGIIHDDLVSLFRE